MIYWNFLTIPRKKIPPIKRDEIVSAQKILIIRNEVIVKDFVVNANNEIIICGKKVLINDEEHRIEVNGVILYSKDYENWELLYEKQGISYSRKKMTGNSSVFNKIGADEQGTFWVVGDNKNFLKIQHSGK